ncbi:MAG: NADH-quinone oxidoreductase subunit J, partial [Phycisphaerae bacterium]
VAGLAVMLAARFGGHPGQMALFGVLTLLSLGGAVCVITHPKPVYSALFFVMVALSTVGMLVMSGAEFLGAALVIVYAGAILVTYVFVIMLAQQSEMDSDVVPGGPLDYDRQARRPGAAVFAGFVQIGAIAGVLVQRSWPPTPSPAASSEGNTVQLGVEVLTRYAVSVELAGVLLLVAIVGAIALARKSVPSERKPYEDEEAPPGDIGRRVKPF